MVLLMQKQQEGCLYDNTGKKVGMLCLSLQCEEINI